MNTKPPPRAARLSPPTCAPGSSNELPGGGFLWSSSLLDRGLRRTRAIASNSPAPRLKSGRCCGEKIFHRTPTVIRPVPRSSSAVSTGFRIRHGRGSAFPKNRPPSTRHRFHYQNKRNFTSSPHARPAADARASIGSMHRQDPGTTCWSNAGRAIRAVHQQSNNAANREPPAAWLECGRPNADLPKATACPCKSHAGAFRQTDGAVLFGVDSFWQGVDCAGEALSNGIHHEAAIHSAGPPAGGGPVAKRSAAWRPPFMDYTLRKRS